MNAIIKIITFVVVLSGLIFVVSLLPIGPRSTGPIENTQGIPYPRLQDKIIVTEELAHADVYLREPVLGKNLVLEIDFTPVNITSLAVGVREDSFWLSYGSRQEIYPTPTEGVSTVSVEIPLTDKLQEADRSLDLMFFAQAPDGQEPQWELHDLKIRTSYAPITYTEFRNYLGSLINRERAL